MSEPLRLSLYEEYKEGVTTMEYLTLFGVILAITMPSIILMWIVIWAMNKWG